MALTHHAKHHPDTECKDHPQPKETGQHGAHFWFFLRYIGKNWCKYKMQNTLLSQAMTGQGLGMVRFILQSLAAAAAEAPAHLSAWQRFWFERFSTLWTLPNRA